uniref:Uncharacterized protein n=1 Tax=Setaria italica TaxID=4555 RepID=K3YSV2_SETIT
MVLLLYKITTTICTSQFFQRNFEHYHVDYSRKSAPCCPQTERSISFACETRSLFRFLRSNLLFPFYVGSRCVTAFSSSTATSRDAAPAFAQDALPPMQSRRTLPLVGTSAASTAATRFSLSLVNDEEDTSPLSELNVILDAENEKKESFPENVLARIDCHLLGWQSGALRPSRLLPSPALRPRRDCKLCSLAAAISLRTCSGSRSVNRSRSRSSRTAREWPVECDRASCAVAGRRPDRGRMALRWDPICCSSSASCLRSSSSSSVTTSITTATGSGPSPCRATTVSLEMLLATGIDPKLGSSSLLVSLFGSRLQRQTGQVTWLASHSPMQSGWKAWLHLGNSLSRSSSSNSLRHTAHSSAPPFPIRSALASAYLMVGNASTTSASSPRGRRCLRDREMKASKLGTAARSSSDLAA